MKFKFIFSFIASILLAVVLPAQTKGLIDSPTISWTGVPGVSAQANAVKQLSITSDASGLKLVGDVSAPGNWYFYGTNGSGVKSYYLLPVDTDATITTTDVTTNNASTSKHGFMPKGTGSTTTFYRSDGTQATPAGGGDVAQSGNNAFTGNNTTAKNFTTLDNAAPTTGTAALALGSNYTTALTSNYSFTSLTGTSGRSKIHLTGCNGTATFTWTTAAQRAGDPVGTTTTMTPTAGDHTIQFYYDTVSSAYFYTDDVSGPVNLAGGATSVSGILPTGNLPAVVTTAANSVTFVLTIDALADAMNYTIAYVPAAFTITELRFVHHGTLTSPSIVPTIKHGTDRSSGTAVVSSPAAVTNATTGATVTSFTSATTAANAWIWIETASKSGTTDKFTVAITGHY